MKVHRIALFGEVLADIFPSETVLGGAPYNVTRHLRALQQQPLLISKVGRDNLKKRLFEELSQLDINTLGIQLDAVYPTGQVTVHMKGGDHRFDICPNQAYDYIESNEALQVAQTYQPDIIYFGTLAQRNHTSSTALEALLTDASCTKFLDLNLRAPWYNRETIERALRHANIVKMNDDELTTLAQLFGCESMLVESFGLHLIKTYHLTTLYVTSGEAGAWALSQSGKRSQVNGHVLGSSFVDTVGAGDAFSAVAVLGYLYDWTVEKTLESANTLAAELCKNRGAVPKNQTCYLTLINNYMSKNS